METASKYMRILIAIEPLMYRQTLAHTLSQRDPPPEIRLSTSEDLDGELEQFRPDLVICDEATQKIISSVPARVVIIYEDGLDARATVGNKEVEYTNISIQDMHGIVDEIHSLDSGDSGDATAGVR